MSKSSTTKLLVLGVIKLHGRAHGYQVRRELLMWSADQWANVHQGSIYNALKRLTSDGLLELAETERGDAGPDRTAYRLTPDGETELDLLLRRAVLEHESAVPLSAVISLLPLLPRKQVIDLLTHRRVGLEGALEQNRRLVEDNDRLGKPGHVAEMFRLWAGQIGAELRWLDELVSRLEAGEYRLEGE